MVQHACTSAENLISSLTQEIVGTPVIQQRDRNTFAQMRTARAEFV